MAINGEQIYCEVAGCGPAVVLIHGWTLNLRMWDPQVERLRDRFRVVCYDRRGYGRSTGREDLSWDAADLTGLLDRLGVERAHILGMSMGGDVAMRFVRAFPDRASSLILHGSTAPSGFPLPWSGADRVRVRELGALARAGGLEAFRQRWRTHPLMRVPADRPDVAARLDEILAAYPGRHLLDPAPPSGPVGPVAMDDLPRLSLPTLVVIGDDEVPYLQIVARAVAYYLPNAQLAVIPGGGHLVNMVAPAPYTDAILRFLEAAEPSPP